jgi:hypothetical protein
LYVIILEDIIVNYENKEETPILKEVHITNGAVEYIDLKDKIKNLEEYIDGSPAVNYDPQKNISY